MSFEGFKELVAILTSTQNVARNIVELSISLPSIKIPLEITVIDTPGFNPGEDNVDNHLEITSHVVEHVADLALVLIPAKMAMSNTLRNFLSDKLNPYLHRCVFIITKSDEISLNDREPLMDFVKGVLSTIGVCNPQVMMVSARTALPVKKIPASMAEEWAYWSDDFSRNEEVLWRKLRDFAQIVIEEHAYRLLKKLIIDIEESLDLLKSQLTRTAEILEQNQICRIEHMTSAILDKESSFLRGVAKSLDISSNSYLDNSLAFSRVLINQGKSLSDYDKVQAPRIQSYVSSTTQKYISACKDKFQILDNCAVKSICNFKKEFESHYRDMPALAPEFSSMGVAAQFATTRFESGNESKIASDEQLSQQGLKMGAFAGSAIGTFILPGVGTIIGGLIGGALGGLGFTRSEKEIQEKVFNSLRSSLQKHFNERKAFINLKLEQRVNQHLALLNKYCLEHIHAYKENVNTLIESQNKQKMQLERHLQQSTASLEAIKDYNKLLSEQLQQLKKHN